MKQVSGSTFSFSKIEDSQWAGLPATERNGMVWKFSDETSRPKPCDGVCIPPLPSYLIIKFPEEFCMIRFHKIINMRDKGATSISEQQAIKISEKIIKLE